MLGLAYAFSTNRRAIRVKTVAWGLGLQFVFAIFVLRVDVGRRMFQVSRRRRQQRAQLLFRRFRSLSLAISGKAVLEHRIHLSLSRFCRSSSSSARFFAILYHFGIMQLIIRIAAWVMTRVMGASGAESLNVAASIFMGQTEAPVTIRPFLPDLTRSELMTVMTSGMAHVSGSNHGRVFRLRRRAQTRAERRHHDRAGHDADGENARARNRAAKNRRQSRHERRRKRSERKKRICWARSLAAPATVCTWRSTSPPC